MRYVIPTQRPNSCVMQSCQRDSPRIELVCERLGRISNILTWSEIKGRIDMAQHCTHSPSFVHLVRVTRACLKATLRIAETGVCFGWCLVSHYRSLLVEKEGGFKMGKTLFACRINLLKVGGVAFNVGLIASHPGKSDESNDRGRHQRSPSACLSSPVLEDSQSVQLQRMSGFYACSLTGNWSGTGFLFM